MAKLNKYTHALEAEPEDIAEMIKGRTKQSDMFDVDLAERLAALPIYKNVMGMYRTSDQYVNSPRVAEVLLHEVGVRDVIEFCVTALEKRSGDKQS